MLLLNMVELPVANINCAHGNTYKANFICNNKVTTTHAVATLIELCLKKQNNKNWPTRALQVKCKSKFPNHKICTVLDF